jgi:hypothetical protein
LIFDVFVGEMLWFVVFYKFSLENVGSKFIRNIGNHLTGTNFKTHRVIDSAVD